MQQTRLFGIRHHGPGSAASLLKALDAFAPQVIVIEAPADTEGCWDYLKWQGFQLPVAVLVYNTDDLAQACYYPFAVFSPEWNAVQYALAQSIPVVNMDLPQSVRWAYQQKTQTETTLFHTLPLIENDHPDSASTQQAMQQDPLGYLAGLAGYSDIERWWEVMLENKTNEAAIFDTLLLMMSEMRAAAAPASGMEALREAYMRQTLREVQKKGYERIAVVCGAWHTPVLANIKQYKAADDKQLLKGIGKVKTQYTWIPWTYQRLATQSGYGAGVISPAWYEFIFTAQADAVIQWMSKAAVLLREQDLEASAASVIEAVRLADTLAALRYRHLPGIEELWEAAVAVFGQGNGQLLELVRHRWIIGNKVGDVPSKVPTVPLHSDIEAQAKSLRIPKPADKTWLKGTKDKPKGGIDLRKEHDRLQSQFLHRLNVLGIGWGEPSEATGREQGTMNEYWHLQWKPELVLDIIEVGMWGNTLEEACTRYVFHQSQKINDLSQLAQLFQKGLKANLPAAIQALAQQLQKIAALTTDVAQLVESLAPLSYALRYGDVRQTDKNLLQMLVQELIPRICIGFPNACAALEEEASRRWKKIMETMHQTLALLQQKGYYEQWYHTLFLVSRQESVHALLAGNAVRLLLDAQQIPLEQAANLLYQQLSPAQAILQAASWIEGFLSGNGLLLLHHPRLWKMIDEWMGSLSDEPFQTALPVLRRTFAQFSVPERQKMLQMARNKDKATSPSNDFMVIDQALVAEWMPTMLAVLA